MRFLSNDLSLHPLHLSMLTIILAHLYSCYAATGRLPCSSPWLWTASGSPTARSTSAGLPPAGLPSATTATAMAAAAWPASVWPASPRLPSRLPSSTSRLPPAAAAGEARQHQGTPKHGFMYSDLQGTEFHDSGPKASNLAQLVFRSWHLV